MRERRESLAYALAVLTLQAGYAIGASTYPNHFYGFNQLRYLGPLGVVAVIGIAWLSVPWGCRNEPPASRKDSVYSIMIQIALALGASVLFFLLRSNMPNPDGTTLIEEMPADVALNGARLTHDEMLELLVHSRIFAVAHRFWGWSVELSYQVPAAMAGGLFVSLMTLLARQCAKNRRVEFMALALCGGYIQLFFGDVENYSLVTVLILAYLVMCWWYVAGRVALWAPCLTLSLAICFHLVAGWFVPSLVYLVLRDRRERRSVTIPALAATLILPIGALLVFLHFHGLPIQRLFDSSHVSGMGGHYERYIPPLRARYFGGLINTVFLLIPTVVMLPVLAGLGQLGCDTYSRFLQVAGGTTLVMTVLWRAQIGVYEDWNLYAPGMIPVALLIAYRFVESEGMARHLVRALLIAGYSHCLLWVLANHFRWGGNP